MIEQIGILLCGVTAVFLSQCEGIKYRRWACIFGLMGQPFWFYATYVANQWGIFMVCFLYLFSWLKGFYTYWPQIWCRIFGHDPKPYHSAHTLKRYAEDHVIETVYCDRCKVNLPPERFV